MGKESSPAIHSGPKHLSYGLNSIEPRRGRVGKAWHISSSRQQNWMASSQHPFCKSLRIHENEIAREYTKLSANQRSWIWIRQSRKRAKMRERSKQQGVPQTLTEVNYWLRSHLAFQYRCFSIKQRRYNSAVCDRAWVSGYNALITRSFRMPSP